MTILDEIFAHKRIEVTAAKQRVSEIELQRQVEAMPVPPDFIRALTDSSKPAPRLIAEVKHRSPSKGVLCPDFDPLRLARTYAENGAAAISVLTDEKYFGGKLEFLSAIANVVPTIPLLRKDFIFDRYQLLEARAAGASAVLLIVAMLEQVVLRKLISEAKKLSLTPLVEVHSRTELDRALNAGAKAIGINNRDLHTFDVSLQTTIDLLPHIPKGVVVVAESGIKTIKNVRTLGKAGVDAVLVGEGIVTVKDHAKMVGLFAQNNKTIKQLLDQMTKKAEIIIEGDLNDPSIRECPYCQSEQLIFSFALRKSSLNPGYGLYLFCRNCFETQHFHLAGDKPKNFREEFVMPYFQNLQDEVIHDVENMFKEKN